MLSVQIFGELRLSVDGAPIELRGSQRRRVAALLCAHAPAAVSTAALAECLDPGSHSANPANAVQAHIRRLRTAIEPGVPGSASRRLPAIGDGYALRPDHVDLWDLRSSIDDARSRRDRDPRAAAHLMATVLERWDRPWGALGEDPLLSESVWDLEVERLGIEDEWASLVVSAGADARSCDRMVELARNEPTREARAADTMQALFQVGRQADALRLFDAVREQLRDSLGVSPGPELDDMYVRVLRHDPSLRARALQVLGLPSRIRVDPLVGRRDELGRLTELVARHRIVSVVGPPGIGSTRLVEHWVTSSSPGDTAVWIDVLGAVDGLDAALGDALGVGDSSEADGRLGPSRRALPHGPLIVVVDGAEHRLDESAEMVLSLVDARAELHVVVTSKAPLDLPGEQVLVIDPLPVGDAAGGPEGAAVELAADRLGPGAPLEVARRTARTAAGLPLAIELEAGASGASSTPLVPGAVGSLDDVVHAAVLRLSPSARGLLARASGLPDGIGAESTEWHCDRARDPAVADPHEHRRLLGELVRAQLVEVHHAEHGTRYLARPQVAPVLGDGGADRGGVVSVAAANVEWVCHLAGPGLDPPLVPDSSRRALLGAEPRNVSAAVVSLRESSWSQHVELLVALVPQLGRLPARSRLRREIERSRTLVDDPLDDARLMIAEAIMVPDMAGVAARRAELEVALAVLERGPVVPEWTVGARVANAIAAGWNGDVEGAAAHLAVAQDRAATLESDWSRAVVDRYRSILTLVQGDAVSAVAIAVDAADRLVAVGDPVEALGALHFAATASWSTSAVDTLALLDRAESVVGAAGSVFEPLLRAERARYALSVGAPDSAELLADAAVSLEAAGMLRTAAMTRRRLGLLHAVEGRRSDALEQLLCAADALLALDPAGAALAVGGLIGLLDLRRATPSPDDLAHRLGTVAVALSTARGTPLTDGERAELGQMVGAPAGAAAPLDRLADTDVVGVAQDLLQLLRS